MELLTIGYAKKSAMTFFEMLKNNRIDVLVDIRLYNSSQLAGFTKSKDLKYFARELCGCEYKWAPQFAPTAELLNGYKAGNIDWNEYERIYRQSLDTRGGLDFFDEFDGKRVYLLCAEDKPQRCHRRLLAERVSDRVVHL